jgi:hypothetical protein
MDSHSQFLYGTTVVKKRLCLSRQMYSLRAEKSYGRHRFEKTDDTIGEKLLARRLHHYQLVSMI